MGSIGTHFGSKLGYTKGLTRFSKVAIQATAQMVADNTRKTLAYRESTCMNLSVTCPYEIIAYSVLKHIISTRMHTISRQVSPLIYGPLRKRILCKIQLTLTFHKHEVMSSGLFTCRNVEKIYSGLYFHDH